MQFFITVEGPNGVGKSTFIKKLEEALSTSYKVYTTKEPSDTEFGNYVKKNEGGLQGEAYAYLVAADRSYHLNNYVEPALDRGEIVISDRYIESSLVLQVYDGVMTEDVWRLNCCFRIPDLSIILLGNERTIAERLSKRENLTHFEKKMTRDDELTGYMKAADFLKDKGFHIILFNNNTEADMINNINKVKDIITQSEGSIENE